MTTVVKVEQASLSPALRALLLGIVFFVSGSSGLIYEVAWTRTLRLEVGSTTLSHTIVLTAFMGGLALGAWLAGRRVDRSERPLRIYAGLELAIGAYGLALPFLVHAVEPLLGELYRAFEGRPGLFALGELALLGPVILPGSALMGATLPALGRAVASADAESSAKGVAKAGGWLYAVNTLGAAVGAGLSGFVLMPTFGLLATSFTAALANVLLAISVLVIDGMSSRESSPRKSTPELPKVEERGHERIGAFAVLLTGLAGMTLQIVWTKLFVTSAGSSTFAFTGVVAVYIMGIGSGAAVGTRLLAFKRVHVAWLLAAAALGSALAAAFTGPFFAWLPTYVTTITAENLKESLKKGMLASVLGREMFFLLLGLGPATLCLGATFPLGVAVAGGSPDRPGRALARVSSASSLGSILGALLGGLVLLPRLGLTDALRAGAILMGLAGVAAIAATPATAARRARAALLALVPLVVLVLSLPGPDARLLDSGSYLVRATFRVQEAVKQAAASNTAVDKKAALRRKDKLVKHGEGDDLVAAIYTTGYDEYLVINGKVDASSSADAETQLHVAHISLFLHGGQPKKVCVIGLGSGMTAGACLAFPGVEKVDLVEISPTVVDVVSSSRLFSLLSHDALKDPRLRLLVADGRTHIAHTNERYDVLISEPTNPWIAGVGDLYTVEHFQRLKERLAPGGIVGQWLQGYSTTSELFWTIVRTFTTVFPDTQIWRFAQGEDFLLVSRREGGDLTMKLADVKAIAATSPRLVDSLEVGGVQSAASFEWFFALDAAGVRKLAGTGPINTDDSGYLEFAAPAALFVDYAFPLDADPMAVEYQQSSSSPFPDADPADLATIREIRPRYYEACRKYRSDAPGALEKADDILRDVLARSPPPATFIRTARSEVLALRLLRNELKDDESVREALEAIRSVHSRSPRVLAAAALAAKRIGENNLAATYYKRIVAVRPFWNEGRIRLAQLLVGTREWEEALAALDGVEDDPDAPLLQAEALIYRGAALAGKGELDKALPFLERGLALDPQHFRGWVSLGDLNVKKRAFDKARDAFAKAVEIEPTNAAVWYNVAAASFAAQDRARARLACARVLEIEPQDRRARALLAELDKGAAH